MVFSSLLFIFVFLPLALIVYYLSPKSLKNLTIMFLGLIFYAWGEPIYVFIMIFSIIFDFINGMLIEKNRQHKNFIKGILIFSLLINIGMLCFFKYYDFFITTLNNIMSINIPIHKLPLPLGISFYTFQTLSYIIDVYLGKVEAQRNIINYGAYVTMFPQLIAGPIVKYSHLSPQLENHKTNINDFGKGVELFIVGLGKKVLLANNIGLLWLQIKLIPTENLSVLSAWLGIIAFTFQIYFDFSGYSDMACGIAKMMGFNLVDNFNYPYIANSITDFWRRWHISLGLWFREYVYIPLGGNRKGKLKHYLNLFIVWFLTGLWHGASWNFIIWGLYFGFFIVLEKIFLLKLFDKLPQCFRHVYTLLLVVIGWVFFEIENIGNAFSFIKVLFGISVNNFVDNKALYYLNTNLVMFIILILCSTPLIKKLADIINKKYTWSHSIIAPAIGLLLLLLSTSYLVNQSYNPFLYFRF